MTEHTPDTPRLWTPVYRCCWCQAEFIQRKVLDKLAWVCPNPVCYERQYKWHEVDVDGRLFYLPMPKQVVMEEAVASQAYSAICIGGQRGGGKSGGMRPLAYRYCRTIENFTVLVLRRMFPELLRNHIQKAQREAKRIGAKFANNKLTFPETDALMEFSHCQDDDDFKAYIGAEFDLVIFDQLEAFTEEQFTEIGAAAGRIPRDNWRGLILAGENPGGPLSSFVDEIFISQKRDRKKYPDYDPKQYCFIESALEDNPNVDKRYVNFLAAIKPEKREMYRWGRRDIFPDQFFKSFTADARIQRVTVPKYVPRIGGLHWAFIRPGIFLWSVVLPDGRLYIEQEWEFTETPADDLAGEILEITAARGWTLDRTFGNPPSDVPERQRGEDAFEVMRRAGLAVVRSRHHDVSGWQRLQQWLKPIKAQDGSLVPALILSPECEVLAAALPKLLQDQLDKENIRAAEYDFSAKALRYIVMSRPSVTTLEPTPQARDLSNFDDKTRRDIARSNRHDARARSGDLTVDDAGYPWGEMYGGVANSDEPW